VKDPTSADFIEKGQSGKVTGIIFPPPDIRAIVDKTAQFVAKHGKGFEEKIMGSAEGQSTKFNFMKAHDPYNAYYEFKIKEFEEGGPAKPPAPPAAPAPAAGEAGGEEKEEVKDGEDKGSKGGATGIVRKQKMSAIAKALTSRPTTAPNPFAFSLVHPSAISALDLDIIKLTAQYTAVSGRQFLAGLAQREQRNPQFDFLKPTHLLFSYFTALVDSYSKVLTPSSAQRESVEKGQDAQEVLRRAVHRWEWERQEHEKNARRQAEDDRLEQAYLRVDWHDFVVVETIDFPESDMLDGAPPPTPLGAATPAPLPPSAAPAADDEGDDMDMDMDMDEAPAPAPTPKPPAAAAAAAAAPADDEEEVPITVVKNYQPEVARGVAVPKTMVDPISGRQVPISEMSEHMRIQLMDPKWREEQKRLQAKTAEETLAAGEQIAQSLQSFAKQRGDIFGSTEEEEEALKRDMAKKAAAAPLEGRRVIWDGHSASVHATQQESMAASAASAAAGHTPAHAAPTKPAAPSPAQPSAGPAPPEKPPASSTGSTNTSFASAIAAAKASVSARQPASGPTGGGTLSAPMILQPMAPGMMPPGGPPRGPMGMHGMRPPPMGGMPPAHGGPGFGMPPMGMPPPGGAPPPPPAAAPQAPPQSPAPAAGGTDKAAAPPAGQDATSEPAAKKPRTAMGLVSADEYAESFEGELQVSIKLPTPTDQSNPEWNLTGQTVSVEVPITMLVKDIKIKLSEQHLGGMPPNKYQLRSEEKGYLKDKLSAAHYNLKSGETLHLKAKSRGGR